MLSTDRLAGFSLLATLTDAQREAVAATAREVSFAAGERLFEEGGAAKGCWLIRTGRVNLETVAPGKPHLIVQTLGTGDVLGWSWFIEPRQWHFGAVAIEAVTAIEFDTDQLRSLAERDTALGYQLAHGLFEALLQRLQNTRARLLDLYGSPRER
jgi:CRP-like cAMP-binding protein